MPFLDDSFFQGAYDALLETLKTDSRLRRDMVQFLMDEGFWDADMKWDSAVARFNACLNRGKGEFFKVSELWALMKRFDRHQLFLAMADDLGYEVRRRPTLERVQLLLEQISDSLATRQTQEARLAAALEQLQSADLASDAKPAAYGRVKFSRAREAF